MLLVDYGRLYLYCLLTLFAIFCYLFFTFVFVMINVKCR